MKIKLYEHPLAVVEPKVFEANSVAEWLLNYYGEVPNVALQIYKGEPSAETEVSSDAKELIYGQENYYTVLQNPGAPPVIAFLIQVAIAVAISVVMSILFPPPDMPGNVNRTQASPNNSLASRENQVRLSQRVEDIYGTVKAIPSLMMPTYNKYINHKQMEYGYYCVGRGYYDIAKLKEGDTLLSSISKSGARVYAPFTSPNSGTAQTSIGETITEGILTVSRPEQVNGITLKARNQVQLPTSASYQFSGNTITQIRNSEGDIVSNPNFQSVCSPGDEIVISSTATSGETGDWHDAEHVIVDQNVADHWHISSTATQDYNGTYIIDSVGDGVITLEAASFANITQTARIQLAAVSEYTDWVTLDDADRTQIWCNVVAPSGIYADAGEGKLAITTNFSIEVQQLNSTSLAPMGTVVTITGSLSGGTADERAVTVEHTTSWVGPARVRMKRTNDYSYGFKGTIIDEIKWRDVYAVTPVTNLHFGNKTTIQTVSQATPRATNVKQRQLNCIASRKLPIYNGTTFSGAFDSTGLHVSGTISATSKLVNILHAITVDPYIGASISQLDLLQVWGVQQELDAWSSSAGQFNYTFDSDTTSFEETIVTVANAGFCLAYRQNGKIRLAFDKLQTSSTALFTHRNKKPNSESISRTFTTESEYDGIEFVFRDPDTDQTETIKLPLDGSSTKYKKYEIPGIRSFTQAWYRANREYQRLRGQRLSIETDCTTDARLLLPNTRVDIVDNTRFKAYDGEVVKQDGLVLTLSREVTFGTGVHSILLMKRDGSLQSIICTAGASSNQVVLQSLPAEALVTTGGYDGIRTIFSFASDDARLAQAWLVQEIGLSDNQYIKIKAINYSPMYYYYDTQVVPAKASVINSGV